jgi:hypothetical protein
LFEIRFWLTVKCDPGMYCVNGTAIACPAGTYQSQAGSQSCTPCDTMSYSNITARTTSCDILPSGAFMFCGLNRSDVCTISLSTHTTTPLCGIGYYTDAARTVNLGACPAGYFCSGAVKQPCAAGYYQDLPGQSTCKPCGDAHYFAFPARDSKCIVIPVGYYGVGGVERARTDIQPCEVGHYCTGESRRCRSAT